MLATRWQIVPNGSYDGPYWCPEQARPRAVLLDQL
jgi:hypothetical protein